MPPSVEKTAVLRMVRIGMSILFHLGWHGYGAGRWPRIRQEHGIPWLREPYELTEGFREGQILRGLRQWLLETLTYCSNYYGPTDTNPVLR